MSPRPQVPKTNAMRHLDTLRIPYTPVTYPETIVTARSVAEIVGVPPDQVFKTLVMLADDRPVLVMAGGDGEVNFKRLAAALGARSVRMAPKTAAETLTGLQTGGIGALALTHKSFPVYIDQRALEHERILVNGGRRGLNLHLAVSDLIAATGARPVPIS